jgi:hypothetical protein
MLAEALDMDATLTRLDLAASNISVGGARSLAAALDTSFIHAARPSFGP